MEKKKINITALQICSIVGNKEKNFETVNRILAGIKETDVIILPEVWSTGWDCENFQKYAETPDKSITLEFLKSVARRLNTNIIGGSFIHKTYTGNCYNSCPIIDRNGELLGLYSKNHLYSYYGSNEGKFLSKGKNPLMVILEGVKFGISICYDIRFPELYRCYRKSGADILVNCAAWASTKPIPWEMMTKSRAIENQTFMVAVNQFGPSTMGETNLGHSRIIDYNGNVLSELLNGEGLIQAEIDLDEMYKFREKCTILHDIKDSYEVKICKK